MREGTKIGRHYLAALFAVLLAVLLAPVCARAASLGSEDSFDINDYDVMYRLYNRYTGEHFYTADAAERSRLVEVGWTSEGIGWLAPGGDEGTPVYRLYNSHVSGGDHHYTIDKAEYDALCAVGWTGEGVGWYSLTSSEGTRLYRLYNPYARTGTHHYAMSTAERDALVAAGWRYEGSAWYGVPGGLRTAYDQLGKGYEDGAEGPDAFDCSGLVYYCYGTERGRTTSDMIQSLKSSGNWTDDIDDLKVGDLAFTSEGHVGIYVGNRRYIEASTSELGVIEEYMYSFYGGGSYY